MCCLPIVFDAAERFRVLYRLSPADRPETYFVLISLWWRYEITSEKGRAGGKISRGAYSGSLISSWVTYICQHSVAVGIFFLHSLKIKANLRGVRESGQYRIGVWEQRGHRPPCDILFPQVITTSLHSFSSLDFLSGSSHHAFLVAFNSFFSLLGSEGGGLECCVPGCLCCCAMWSWRMEVGWGEGPHLVWIQNTVLGQAPTKA